MTHWKSLSLKTTESTANPASTVVMGANAVSCIETSDVAVATTTQGGWTEDALPIAAVRAFISCTASSDARSVVRWLVQGGLLIDSYLAAPRGNFHRNLGPRGGLTPVSVRHGGGLGPRCHATPRGRRNGEDGGGDGRLPRRCRPARVG